MGGGDAPEEELEQQVMSEVHVGCPPYLSGPHVSRFTFSLPPEVEPSRYNELFKAETACVREVITLDDDGDLVLPRRNRQSCHCFSVTIQHNITSSIPSVGLQVWKAELVLSDFVMQKMCTSDEFDGVISLELGAGTGLVGILLSCVAQTVLLTDHGDDILDNCAKNIELNSGVFSHQGLVHARELNWMNPWPPEVSYSSASHERYYTWPWKSVTTLVLMTLMLWQMVIHISEAISGWKENVRGLNVHPFLFLWVNALI